MCSPLPSHMIPMECPFETQPGVTLRSQPYRLPEHKRQMVQKELAEMLKLGVIEESHSTWCSPIVFGVKKDGAIWFCVEYRKVNEISQFDATGRRAPGLVRHCSLFVTMLLRFGLCQIPSASWTACCVHKLHILLLPR